MDFPIEGLHTETGPGVLEAAIRVDDALDAADKAALFKTFTKVLAQRRGWMATFMAKWSNDWPGEAATSTCRCGRAASRRSTTRGAAPMTDVHALVRRRTAGADARAPGHGRLHGELLPA